MVSAKFPHRVCQLIEPYLTSNKGLSKQQDIADFDAAKIIKLEFNHAAERQGSKQVAQQFETPLENYLGNLGSTQEKLHAVVGLCTTVAFANRNRDAATKEATGERPK